MRRFGLAVLLILLAFVMLWSGCQNPALTGAKVYIQQQDWDNALEQLKIAVQQEPGNAEAYYLLGRAYGEKQMYQDMVKAFQTSLDISDTWRPNIESLRTEKWTVAFNRGIQASKQEDFEKALEEFQTATIIDPENPDAFNNLGYVYTNLDRLDDALAAYDKVFELAPDNVPAKINSGVIFFKRDEFQKAADIFGEVLQAEPANKSALTMRGRSLESLAMHQKTELKAANTPEDSLRIREQVDAVLDQAMQVYAQAQEAYPGEKSFFFDLGALYFENFRDYQAAIPMFQRVTEIDSADVDAWFNLALAQLALNDLAGAQISLESVVELEPENGDAWYHLGVVYIKKGMKTEGEQAFKRSEEIKGESE